MRETGLLVAKQISTDLSLVYEDYAIYQVGDDIKVDTCITILGQEGLNQNMELTFTSDWKFVSGRLQPSAHIKNASIVMENESDAVIEVTDESGGITKRIFKIEPGYLPIAIFSGSLLMPFLWLRNFVTRSSRDIRYQVIPQGALIVTGASADSISIEFVFDGMGVDYTIQYDPKDGRMIRCQSSKQQIIIEHAA